jgi:hypothetical protein
LGSYIHITVAPRQSAWFSTNQSFTSPAPAPSKGRAGLGNLENKMLPKTGKSGLFKHCQYPRTTSIIGAPMTFGQPYVGTVSLMSHSFV